MESIRDLNLEADDMQAVLSALERVNRRIKEVAQTHKPLFGGEHFLTSKEVCEQLYISPRTLQDYRDKGIIPYMQFAGKILYKESDLERLTSKQRFMCLCHFLNPSVHSFKCGQHHLHIIRFHIQVLY